MRLSWARKKTTPRSATGLDVSTVLLVIGKRAVLMMARSRMRSSAFGAQRISSTMLQVSLVNSFPITGVTMTGPKASSVPVEC